MNATYQFPLRTVAGEQWCCLSSKGIKRLDVVAYDVRHKEHHSFAGGHRHRMYIFHGDIHLKFHEVATDVALNIAAVQPAQPKPVKKSRHGRKKGR